MIAVVPDQPTVLAQAIADGDGGIRRFSDAEGTAMRAFGVAFRVDDAIHTRLLGYGIDLEQASGQTHRWLPVPSVFLIDAAGTVRFVHADPDHTQRLDAEQLTTALRSVAP